MATVMKSATKATARDKRRKAESDTDSDDSAVLMAKLDERNRRKKAKVELKAKQDEEAAILKMLTSSSDPFEVIRGHVPMQTLNGILLPWLIAEY
jgi:hypothetical protein